MSSPFYPIPLLRSFKDYLIGAEKTVTIFSSTLPTKYNGDGIPPPSRFEAKCHPDEEKITSEVDGYFLEHWPFENEKARKRFVAAGFSKVTCLYFPMAHNDRIHFACRLLTLLFLIDDILEDMSFDEGSAYNENLIPIARGDVLPNRSIPVEWITYDLWESMREFDRPLADQILEPVFTFMRAQTDKARLSITSMGPWYTERRMLEKRMPIYCLLCALMRFSMGLHLTDEQIKSVEPIEQNCAKHLSVLNDIYSWDKELRASQTGHAEGSAICSAVEILSKETSLSYPAAKRVLWIMCREWELTHDILVANRQLGGYLPCSKDLMAYIKGLEYQISGNERWSATTLRYHSPN